MEAMPLQLSQEAVKAIPALACSTSATLALLRPLCLPPAVSVSQHFLVLVLKHTLGFRDVLT